MVIICIFVALMRIDAFFSDVRLQNLPFKPSSAVDPKIILSSSRLLNQPTRLSAYLPEYDTPLSSSGGLIAVSPPFETDALGLLNFCLRNSDTALSGPSRSKMLNEATNIVFKSIIIGFPHFTLIGISLSLLDAYYN